MSKSLSSKYGQKLFSTTKEMATSTLKTALKKAIQKAAETTGDLVGNKIAEKITKAASVSIREDPRNLTATQIDETSYKQQGYKRKDTYLQRDNNKLLMNLNIIIANIKQENRV